LAYLSDLRLRDLDVCDHHALSVWLMLPRVSRGASDASQDRV
jgi:hypothetical protein